MRSSKLAHSTKLSGARGPCDWTRLEQYDGPIKKLAMKNNAVIDCAAGGIDTVAGG